MTDGPSKNLENSESEVVQPPTNGSDAATAAESATLPSPVRRGTGPRTSLGKETSKRNATTHAIFSSVIVLEDESQADVDALLAGLRNYFKPEGELEEVLVDKLTVLFWRLRRLLIAEKDAGGRLAVSPFDGLSPKLDVLLRYETTLNRETDRVLSQFERLQRIRLGLPPTPRLDLTVSTS